MLIFDELDTLLSQTGAVSVGIPHSSSHRIFDGKAFSFETSRG